MPENSSLMRFSLLSRRMSNELQRAYSGFRGCSFCQPPVCTRRNRRWGLLTDRSSPCRGPGSWGILTGCHAFIVAKRMIFFMSFGFDKTGTSVKPEIPAAVIVTVCPVSRGWPQRPAGRRIRCDWSNAPPPVEMYDTWSARAELVDAGYRVAAADEPSRRRSS